MPKKPAFNNKKVTRLLKRFARNKKNTLLRDRIIELALPLIPRALAKQGMYIRPELRDDIIQECALKVVQAIPKFDAERGNAFGFFWATICNMSKSINERLNRPSLSLSTDEEAQRQAESNGKNVFQTPENQHILNSIAKDLQAALDRNSYRVPSRGMHRKACRLVRHFIATGELFFDKSLVIKELREVGLDRKQIQFYVERSLIEVRARLLEAKENADAISYTKISSSVSSVVGGGDI